MATGLLVTLVSLVIVVLLLVFWFFRSRGRRERRVPRKIRTSEEGASL